MLSRYAYKNQAEAVLKNEPWIKNTEKSCFIGLFHHDHKMTYIQQGCSGFIYFFNKIKCCLLKCILNLWSMSNWCLTSIVTFINVISVIHQLFFRKCLIESGVNNSNDIEMMIEKKLCFILQCQDSYQNEERHGSLVYSTKLENYYKGLEVASSQLKIGKLIGRGAFGRVYEGHLHNTKDRDTKRVAVKRLKGDHEGWPLSVHCLFL